MRIGPYEIGEKIGAGGMGEVYRATDTRLGRQVALKVLSVSFAADPGRMERFQREARVLASLNHPNIATLHGIEQDGDRHALVMELVPGEDLAQRIARGPLPLAEALTIAVQVCRALEAAHQQGIVHRDLKPANVMIGGTVKVLDFGLAKAAASESSAEASFSHSPTLTHNATMAGMILGTAAYMSPEQARGKVVDIRTDVFSFGCVLFEMLAGAPAFNGEDLSEILASVIKGDVRWERLPKDLPAPVRELIERCLRMRLDERYQAIGDARIDITALLEHPERLRGVGPAGSTETRPSHLAAGLWGVLGLAIGLAVGWAFLVPSAPAPERELLKFGISAPAPTIRGYTAPRISPDGKAVAFPEEGGIRVRRLDQIEPSSIELPWPTQELGWSADSRTLVVGRRDSPELWRVAASGGEPQLITALPDGGFLWGIAPLDAETMLFGMASLGLFKVPLRGGTPECILPAGENEVLSSPFALPRGRGILFAEAHRGRIEVLDGNERRVLMETEGRRFFYPLYSPSGYLLFNSRYGQTGNWAVPFSLERLEGSGTPFRVLPSGNLSISNDDTLTYLPTTSASVESSQLVWVDRQGAIGGTIGEALLGLSDPVLSPDGRRVAVSAWPDPNRADTNDVVVFDAGTGARYTLSDPLGSDCCPFWWSDGSQVGFVTFAPGIRSLRIIAADGSGQAVELGQAMQASATRDGRFLLFAWQGIRYIENESTEVKLLTDENSRAYDLSPDHRVLAFVRADQPGIFLRSFPDGGGLTAAVAGDAEAPRFSRDGRELYYWSGKTLMAVAIDTTGATAVVGQPRALFSAERARLRSGGRFDVGPDGRFLMLQGVESDPGDEAPAEIVVIRNWSLEYEANR